MAPSRRRTLGGALLSLLPCLTQAVPFGKVDWEAYNRGDLGFSPRHSYLSSDAVAPIIHVERTSPECLNAAHVLLSFGTQAERGNQAMLIDSEGEMVWSHFERGTIHNMAVQQYKGRDYITYWVGDDDYYGHGHGFFKMYDNTYTLTHTLSAGNSLDGDFHEFTITKQNTALVTSYVKTPYDLKFKGREDGFIWDCIFQELDIETNAVVFQWRASDHFKPGTLTVDSWQEWTGNSGDPWDYFHLNSVDKDHHGNYLVAARYTNAVSLISGVNGSIIWNLGGIHNNFTDVGLGDAIKFVDPHMARWDVEGRSITLFDNIAAWSVRNDEKSSHAARIAVNPKSMKAGMIAEFVAPSGVFAHSEGSIQLLENGNFFLGFGSSPYYGEYSSNGTLLCGARFAPPVVGGAKDVKESKPNIVNSYRVAKHSWTGNPMTPPRVRLMDGYLHVSWNGATDVAYWKLAAKSTTGKRRPWKTLGTFRKTGFETKMPYNDAEWFGLHLTAISADHVPFQLWYQDQEGELVEIWDDSIVSPGKARGSYLGGLVFFASSLTVLWLNRRAILGSWIKIHVDPKGLKEVWKF